MGKTASRLFRSTRAVVKPTQPAAVNAARGAYELSKSVFKHYKFCAFLWCHSIAAQKRLVQEVQDSELFSQHKVLQDNLQSVYVQSQSTIKKVQYEHIWHIFTMFRSCHWYGMYAVTIWDCSFNENPHKK